MPIVCRHKNQGAEFIVWEVTESTNDLIGQLNTDDLHQYNTIKSEKRKKEFLAVRIALRSLFNHEIHLIYDEQGKPYIENETDKISISHSGKWIAVITHKQKEVGIDIETQLNKVSRIAHRFLSETELQNVCDSTDEQKMMLAWSGKETIYKIVGNEAVDFMNQMRVLPFDLEPEGEFNIELVFKKKQIPLNYIIHHSYTLVYGILP